MLLADAIPVIETLNGCRTSADVGSVFSDFVRRYGFIAAACGESREILEGRSWEFFFNTWPEAWLKQYQDRDYVRHDLVPALARITSHPFTWVEALAVRDG